TDGKVETETRLFITSSPLDAQRLGSYVRGHWAIENSLHWVMDMTFRDDACRVRNGHGPINLSTIRHVSQNLLRGAPGRLSMNMKSHKAAWDDNYRATVLQAGNAARKISPDSPGGESPFVGSGPKKSPSEILTALLKVPATCQGRRERLNSASVAALQPRRGARP